MTDIYERRLNQIKSFIETSMMKDGKTKDEILADLAELEYEV